MRRSERFDSGSISKAKSERIDGGEIMDIGSTIGRFRPHSVDLWIFSLSRDLVTRMSGLLGCLIRRKS